MNTHLLRSSCAYLVLFSRSSCVLCSYLSLREGEELEVVMFNAGTAVDVNGRLDVDVGKGVEVAREVDVAST